MVGKSGSGTLPVNMFLKIMDGEDFQFVPVGAKLVQLGLAIPTDEGMLDKLDRGKVVKEPSLQPIAEGPAKAVPSDWLSPLPPTSTEFLAVPSHVDWEGNIFICPLTPNQDTIRIVGNVLDSKYQGSVHRPVDRYWTAGQACVARWDLDGRWYRATVLEVRYEGYTVMSVDYGTVEVVKVEDMRKDLLCLVSAQKHTFLVPTI